MNTSKVYYLSSTEEPTNIRYIGITRSSLEKRLYQHIIDQRGSSTHKKNWIKSVILAGYQVIITLIEDNLTINESLKREVYWISNYRNEGFKLTNSTEGAYYNESGEIVYEPIKGKKFTDRHRKNIGLANKNYKPSADCIRRTNITKKLRKCRMKPVCQYTKDNIFIKEWDSASEIKSVLGIDNRNISDACKGKTKTCRGFIWKFKEN